MYGLLLPTPSIKGFCQIGCMIGLGTSLYICNFLPTSGGGPMQRRLPVLAVRPHPGGRRGCSGLSRCIPRWRFSACRCAADAGVRAAMARRCALAFLELSSQEGRRRCQLCFSKDACHGLLHHEVPREDDAVNDAALRRHDPRHPQARRAREASGTASRQRPCRRAGQEKTKNKRRPAKAGAAKMHSLSLHGEQMLLAFVRGNRCFRAHGRRLDRHAP